LSSKSNAKSACTSPVQEYLEQLHSEFAGVTEGKVATYIPELAKANPDWFGICLVTANGTAYEVGDSRQPFTIQSISKPFVYGLALEDHGRQQVVAKVGLEPTGDAFNSISLEPGTGRPRNPMINAGAIATTSLISGKTGPARLRRLLDMFGLYAGRELTLDNEVYRSESDTGHRNRAIGHMLRNFDILTTDPIPSVELYFQQCSVSVTAHDLGVMAATLANGGVNPITGKQAIRGEYVESVLSVMGSCGMYDYAGEWIYRVGIPAKSGVGGGILAALPARLGLGSYSPKLDKHGNSVRGIKVCEALSAHYDLHMLNRSDDARNSIIADYDIGNSPSRRVRRAHEQNILAAHHQDVRVIELVGTLSFSNVDYVSRQLAAKPRPQLVIFDLRRVTAMTRAGTRLLAEEFRELAAHHVTVILSGIMRSSPEWKMIGEWTEGLSNIRNYYLLDAAIEWAEDQVVYRYGGAIDFFEATDISEQALLAGLTDEELTDLTSLASVRTYQASEKIIAAGDPADSLFFLRSGAVHVTLPDGIRLATLTAGMPFGEMALLEPRRSADVLADMAATAYEIPLRDFQRFRKQHPHAGERIMRNLAQLLADRLILANAKLNLLTPG
jgi:glutaminase